MEAIAKRWDAIPPLAVSLAGIAAALGVKRESGKDVEQNMEELAAALGGISRRPEWQMTTK